MSATWPLKIGDTERELSRKFRKGGRVLTHSEVSSIVLRVRSNVLLTFNMIKDTTDGVSWYYRFSNAEIASILNGNPAGEYDIDFELTFVSGRKATDPTLGTGYKLAVAAVV
jgi:hypothetical protein